MTTATQAAPAATLEACAAFWQGRAAGPLSSRSGPPGRPIP